MFVIQGLKTQIPTAQFVRKIQTMNFYELCVFVGQSYKQTEVHLANHTFYTLTGDLPAALVWTVVSFWPLVTRGLGRRLSSRTALQHNRQKRPRARDLILTRPDNCSVCRGRRTQELMEKFPQCRQSTNLKRQMSLQEEYLKKTSECYLII